MKKLKLNLDELKVESFEIPSNIEQGTIFGQQQPSGPNCSYAYAYCTNWSECACLSVGCPITLVCGQTFTCQCTGTCPPYSNLTNCTRNQLCL